MNLTGTLEPTEPHPMAWAAGKYIKSIPLTELQSILEAMSSCALTGNRTAGIIGETLRRFIHGEMVSDRYLLGLAWYLKELKNEQA